MYGGQPYGGGPYAGDTMLVAAIPVDTEPTFSIEVAFTTDALATPAWVDISGDVRSWDVSRGRSRELERFQPGRATVVLDNSDRDYDSQHATGPWFGNLRPMRRLRIRETFSGVTYPRFDGFVDRWNLGYPQGGQDATATVTATDGFKVFARTELGISVYHNEVVADTPRLWMWLDDTQESTVVLDHSGNGFHGTKVGPSSFGSEGLVTNDPGSSMTLSAFVSGVGFLNGALSGATAGVSGVTGWAFEAVVRIGGVPNLDNTVLWEQSSATTNRIAGGYSAGSGLVSFTVDNGAGVQDVVQSNFALTIGTVHHVVWRSSATGVMTIWIDGVNRTDPTPVLGDGVAGGAMARLAVKVGHGIGASAFGPVASFAHFAVYDTALSDARIAVHAAARSAPWQGDLPGVRAGRVLDLADWPASLREIDAGETTFQSASLQTAVLEHLQKTAQTEAGALFMNRAGAVRLISRDALAARVSQATFGDLAPEIGYRAVTYDDGDATIRNRATISRLNGVARTDEDAASIDEFGRFQYTLEGLLHDTDAHSVAYADWVTTNYGQPQRRVVSLELGPAAAGNEATLYPQILGRELGDKVTVKVRHPDGTGAVFSQDVVIEGIADAWDPQGFRTATWTLSPAPGTF